MTETEAQAAILAGFWLHWKANAAAAAKQTKIPEVQWPGEEPKEPKDGARAWARVNVPHSIGAQRGIGDGRSRYERGGVVVVQCFAPRDDRASTLALELARTAKNAFEGRDLAGVSFRNCRVVTVGAEKSWFVVNATAEFSFDEVK